MSNLWAPVIASLISSSAVIAAVVVTQRFQQRAQREHAWWQHRVTTYAEFLAAADDLAAAFKDKSRSPELILAYYRKMHQVSLIASASTALAANELHRHVNAIVFGGDASDRIFEDFVQAAGRFRNAGRSDLGQPLLTLPDSPPVPRS